MKIIEIKEEHKEAARKYAKMLSTKVKDKGPIKRTPEEIYEDNYRGELAHIYFNLFFPTAIENPLHRDKNSKGDNGFDYLSPITKRTIDVKSIQFNKKTKTIPIKDIKARYFVFLLEIEKINSMYFLGGINKDNLIYVLENSQFDNGGEFFRIIKVFPEYENMLKQYNN